MLHTATPAILVIVATVVVAVIAGQKSIARVAPVVHTPLMSYLNALSGLILLGALSMYPAATWGERIALAFAAVMATINLVGGFCVTDRMLRSLRGTDGDGRSRDAE